MPIGVDSTTSDGAHVSKKEENGSYGRFVRYFHPSRPGDILGTDAPAHHELSLFVQEQKLRDSEKTLSGQCPSVVAFFGADYDPAKEDQHQIQQLRQDVKASLSSEKEASPSSRKLHLTRQSASTADAQIVSPSNNCSGTVPFVTAVRVPRNDDLVKDAARRLSLASMNSTAPARTDTGSAELRADIMPFYTTIRKADQMEAVGSRRHLSQDLLLESDPLFRKDSDLSSSAPAIRSTALSAADSPSHRSRPESAASIRFASAVVQQTPPLETRRRKSVAVCRPPSASLGRATNLTKGPQPTTPVSQNMPSSRCPSAAGHRPRASSASPSRLGYRSRPGSALKHLPPAKHSSPDSTGRQAHSPSAARSSTPDALIRKYTGTVTATVEYQ